MARAFCVVLALVAVLALVSRVEAQFDVSDILAQCVTSNFGVALATDWCVFPDDYRVVGFLSPICQGVNNPQSASAMVPSALVPSGMVPPGGIGGMSPTDALAACNIGPNPGQVNEAAARPCIEAFYQTGCQSVCRRYNPTAMLCFMDSAVFPMSYCTDIENKCAVFTNSTCLLSPQGDTYNLLKQTSCVGGQYTFGQSATSEPGFPYVTADVNKIMSQLFPPSPSPTASLSPSAGTSDGDNNNNNLAAPASLSLLALAIAALLLVLA